MPEPAVIAYMKRKPALTAWAVNTILFAVVIIAGCPVYHSGDELNMLQILAGGYGEPASSYLPFLHGMHYFLTVPLKWLFVHLPGINWFTLSMLLAQYLSCTCLCYILLCRKNIAAAIPAYLATFLVFEIWMVLYLNISSTSIVCCLAGLALCWHYFYCLSARRIILIGSILFIVTASVFRIHTLIPVTAVAAPFFLLLPGWRRKAGASVAVIVSILLVLLLFTLQQRYYTNHSAGWVQEEQYRQAKYNYINYYRDTSRTALAPYRLEVAMTENLLLFDTLLPDTKTLNTIAQAGRATMPARQFFSTETWYWHFTNNRLYLLAVALSILLFTHGKKERKVILYACLAGLSLTGYLISCRKLPEFILPGILFILFYFITLTGEYNTPLNTYKRWLYLLLTATLFIWACWRGFKITRQNQVMFHQFNLVYHELSQQPDKLFISIGDGDIFSYFYCFATPQQYPFNNILFIDHPVTSRLPYLTAHFGITSIKDAPLHNNVYFRGPEIPALLSYYREVTGRHFEYTDTIPMFQYSTIRKITAP